MRSSSGRVEAAVAGEGTGVSKKAMIRLLRTEDISNLASILEESSEAARWSGESFEKLQVSEGFLALVSEMAGNVSGFVCGRQMADEGEILNLAVRRQNRKKGEGRALLSAVLGKLQRGGVRRVYLEVRESNTTAIAFYQKQGFSIMGRRPGYYREPEEAAVLMERRLTG
jgi:ribosomal-protein-alanine N-acetyltransferase